MSPDLAKSRSFSPQSHCQLARVPPLSMSWTNQGWGSAPVLQPRRGWDFSHSPRWEGASQLAWAIFIPRMSSIMVQRLTSTMQNIRGNIRSVELDCQPDTCPFIPQFFIFWIFLDVVEQQLIVLQRWRWLWLNWERYRMTIMLRIIIMRLLLIIIIISPLCLTHCNKLPSGINFWEINLFMEILMTRTVEATPMSLIPVLRQ